jgi:hypothetical protein
VVFLVLSRQNGGVVDRLRYADVRPYVVPDTLGELVGPLSGVVELPTHLAWSGLRCFDLGDGRQLGLLYETVIRESMDIADIDRYLNAAVLHQVWPRLWLPTRVRWEWEQRFPSLAQVG